MPFSLWGEGDHTVSCSHAADEARQMHYKMGSRLVMVCHSDGR